MNKKMIFSPFSLLGLILFLFSVQHVFATEITVAIDRTPIAINESFQITFTATQAPNSEPDFSPLLKDFEILNKSQKQNSSWINGQTTQSIEWVLNLMANSTGSLIIPSIAFGNDRSEALALLVTKNVSTVETIGHSNEALFLEVDATPTKPYVQAQVLYTFRFYRKVELAQASLNEPEINDAIIEKLGKDKNYRTQIKGTTYQVTERKYALFPQKSGLTQIEPLILTAEIISNSRSRFNGFFNRSVTKTKRIKSKAISLDVQAVPDEFDAKHWLPAKQLYIKETWSSDITKIKVGEPVTRTLTLISEGTTVSQLPELHSRKEIDQLKTYPDQPVLKEQKDAEGIIALREEKIAYIPSKSGDYRLPAIEIPWFNTQTKTMEIARIPEITVTAIASSIQSEPLSPLPEIPVQITPVKTEPVVIESESVTNNLWMWLSIGLTCGWLLNIFYFIKKSQPKKQQKPIDKKHIKLTDTIKTLKKACRENDSLIAKQALLTWGKIKFNSNTLSAIGSQCEARLRDEINALNRCLYSNYSEPWQGKKLFQTFTENNAREKIAKKTVDEKLEPLYKI